MRDEGDATYQRKLSSRIVLNEEIGAGMGATGRCVHGENSGEMSKHGVQGRLLSEASRWMVTRQQLSHRQMRAFALIDKVGGIRRVEPRALGCGFFDGLRDLTRDRDHP
jgi:hypothetical protein